MNNDFLSVATYNQLVNIESSIRSLNNGKPVPAGLSQEEMNLNALVLENKKRKSAEDDRVAAIERKRVESLIDPEEALGELRKWMSSQKAFRKLAIKLREEAVACPNKNFHNFSGSLNAVNSFVRAEYNANLVRSNTEVPDIKSAHYTP